MNVLVINDYGYVNGGASHVAISSLNALAEIGMNVVFIYGVGPLDPSVNNKLVQTYCLDTKDLFGYRSRIYAFISGIWNFSAASRLRNILTNFDTNQTIIHVHGWSKSLTTSIFKEITSRRFPTVVTLHDYFSVCPNGGLYNYKTNTKCEAQPLSLACIFSSCDSRGPAYKYWRVFRHIVGSIFANFPRSIYTFIYVSAYSKSLMVESLPKNSKFHYVPNPVVTSFDKPATVSHNSEFCFVGRLSPEKGALLFAHASLKAKVDSVFIGDGQEITTLKLINPNARYLGWVAPEIVGSYMRASRALVFPSLWHETQGLVVLEAAAVGVPSVVADGCAASELIEDGVTGLLFRSGDIDDLTEKLKRLNDDELITKLGLNAYEKYWANKSSVEIHATILASSYKKIMWGRDA